MRVTNEQAERDIATYKYNEGKTHIVMSKPIEDRYKYAADLLEARELIKEMRGLIKDVYVSGLSTSRNCAMDRLLERTKEYI